MLRRAGLSSLVIRKTKNFYLSIEVFFGADDEARTRDITPKKLCFSGDPTSD